MNTCQERTRLACPARRAGLEAQKKKREEAAASKRESSAQKAKGSEEAEKQASLTLELNARLLQKAGIKNERKNLVDHIHSQKSFAARWRAWPTRRCACPRWRSPD